jgi:O-antigen ligase
MPAAPSTNSFQKIGLYSYCVYLFSGYANDLSLHFLGGKAYLSWVSGLLVIVAFIGGGNAFRGSKSKIGRAWLGLMCCLILSAPFSIWRGESVDLLKTYVPRILGLFFYCCAFTVTLKNCRTLVITNVACTSAILLCALLFGAADESGRFSIPDSLFFGGANDLALALVCSLGFSLFLILQKSALAQILGAGEFLLTLFYLLKTGSRGGFLALAAFLAVWLIFSKGRWKLIALTIPALAFIVILPGSTLSRLVEIATPGSLNASTANDAAKESQMERTMLLQKSIVYALTNPVLGLGPGTFTDALWRDDVANLTHTHALGTHNTYTQMASECGLPALCFYMLVLFGSIGFNFRIMQRTRSMPGGETVFTMAICLFGSLIAFAIATIFHHDAYSPNLPILSGISAALELASRGGDQRWLEHEIAAGNI